MDERPHARATAAPGLATALIAPRLSPDHVRRARLNERLSHGVRGPVTLICGPPGSGKTSLLCSWLAEPSRSGHVAWVSLDPGHDDTAQLWDAVLAALRGACGDRGAPALGPPVRGSGASFMPRLVNELAAIPEPVVLVLDDVHVLRSRECLEQLAFLVLHAPPTLRIVLSGRADPPLPLHLPRVLGTLTEIRSSDLAFTETESSELLAAHGLALDAALVAVLRRRTEGWAAGLRLAALGLQGHDEPERFVTEFGGDDRVVADYLVAEVLNRQPPRRRRFLLRTSITDRVCGGLADAITGETTGTETLAELERTNGFVVGIDPRGQWYRYHPLFARLLEVRARRELGDGMRELHARAARWHAAEGEVWPALEHGVAAEDWELTARLTVAHGVELLAGGRCRSLGPLVAKLPPEVVAHDAELAAIVACSLLDAGDSATAGPYLETAGRPAESLAPGRLRALAETRAIARLSLARLRGDVRDGLAEADELLADTEFQDDSRGETRRALVSANVGRTALWAGEIGRAAYELEFAVSLARARGLDYLRVGALGHLALLEVTRNGPREALPLAEEALELARRRGWADVPEAAAAHLAAAAAMLYAHQLDAAEEHLRAACRDTREVHLSAAARHLAARILGARGKLEHSLAAHAARASSVGGWGFADPGLTELARARLLITAGDLDAAEDALVAARCGPVAAVQAGFARLRLAGDDPYGALAALEGVRPDLPETRVDLRLQEALAFTALGRPDARQSFEGALAAAERTGVRSVLLEADEQLRGLLLDAIRHGTAHRALVGELLDTLDDREPVTVLADAGLDLTDRELAVIRFLTSTLSNREIASELLISTNTVKTHVRSIYRKLGVPDRRGAVERARALGLITHRRPPAAARVVEALEV